MVAEDQVEAALLEIGLADGQTFSLAGFLNGWGVPFGLLANCDAPDIPPHLRDHPLLSQPISVEAVLNVMRALSGGGERCAPATVPSAQ